MKPESKLTKSQVRDYRVDLANKIIVAHVRHDDQCGNGHNSFSITADVYEPHVQRGEPTLTNAKTGRAMWLNACGCCHDEVEAHFPELAPLLKWHLMSTDEPLHYVANTVYLAGDRDCNGLRKGEKRQLRNGRTGLLVWERVMRDAAGNVVDGGSCHWMDAANQPTDTLTAAWEPVWRVGEGKERELDAARRAAVWPEATDAELCQEPEQLKAALMARLPALMEAFKRDVESLGFTY